MQVATGISILHGIALGKIRIFKHPEYVIDEKTVDDPIPELNRFEQARLKVQAQQQVLYDRAVAAAGEGVRSHLPVPRGHARR
jgi:phosphotransferase system enzyme I (PtsI)